jgi:hypothetical protein
MLPSVNGDTLADDLPVKQVKVSIRKSYDIIRVMETATNYRYMVKTEGIRGGNARIEGLIVLIRRRSRIIECANLLRLLDFAGESGIIGNINFA